MQKVDSLSSPLIQTGEAKFRDYITLLKPRVMSLAIFTAVVGMVVAPGSGEHWALNIISIFCIALGAGAAGAMNMAYEGDVDALMQRTRLRPIPRGVISSETAWVLGGILAALSVMGLALASNYLAAALLAFSIFFYVVIYTIALKRRTDQNIVIGGAAGALPPVIGWAAVTGSLTFTPWLFFLIIFIWTPPHFWALALYKCKDYKKAGIPMLPVTVGAKSACLQIFLYSLVLLPLGVAPVLTGIAGWFYGVVSGVMGVFFLFLVGRLWLVSLKTVETKENIKTKKTSILSSLNSENGRVENIVETKADSIRNQMNREARYVFSFSILYLFVLFLILLIEHINILHF